MHKLEVGAEFETFEITGVPGHSGILFHTGNTNNDSSGCVLLGTDTTRLGISDSRLAFSKFMAMMVGIDKVELHVA